MLPTVQIMQNKSLIAEEGTPLILNCTATGCPTPNITWTKVGNSNALSKTKGNVLVYYFTRLTKQNTGLYRCEANNGVGRTITDVIHVNVTCKFTLCWFLY